MAGTTGPSPGPAVGGTAGANGAAAAAVARWAIRNISPGTITYIAAIARNGDPVIRPGGSKASSNPRRWLKVDSRVQPTGQSLILTNTLPKFKRTFHWLGR